MSFPFCSNNRLVSVIDVIRPTLHFMPLQNLKFGGTGISHHYFIRIVIQTRAVIRLKVMSAKVMQAGAFSTS